MIRNCLIFSLVFICFGQINCVLNPRVVCYYESWFVWRNGNGKMTVDDVDSSLCTDIVYSYMGITSSNEVSIPDDWLMVQKNDLSNFANKKGKGRALIAIGGWSLSANFASMAYSQSSRSNFVNSVKSFLTKFGFDGVTLDWSQASWSSTDFGNFVELLKALHSEFNGKYTLGITVAARAINFDVKKVDDYVDFITVQTYDLHGSWEKEVGYEAPIDWQVQTLREWARAGATMHKLLMTIPFFAHTWILQNPTSDKPGAKATGPGRQGPWSQAEGKLSYNEVCTQLKESASSWTVHRDSAHGAVYAVSKDTWVSFEDAKTCEEKAQNVTTEGYGGVVVQALANEDFRGLCGEKYPLLKAINKGLNKEDVKGRTLPPAPSTTTSAPVTADPHKVCHAEGTVRDPHDCSIYHRCTQMFPGIFSDEQLNCAKDEAYDEKAQKCVNKSLVNGCH